MVGITRSKVFFSTKAPALARQNFLKLIGADGQVLQRGILQVEDGDQITAVALQVEVGIGQRMPLFDQQQMHILYLVYFAIS